MRKVMKKWFPGSVYHGVWLIYVQKNPVGMESCKRQALCMVGRQSRGSGRAGSPSDTLRIGSHAAWKKNWEKGLKTKEVKISLHSSCPGSLALCVCVCARALFCVRNSGQISQPYQDSKAFSSSLSIKSTFWRWMVLTHKLNWSNTYSVYIFLSLCLKLNTNLLPWQDDRKVNCSPWL